MNPHLAIPAPASVVPQRTTAAVPASDMPAAGKLLLIFGLHAALGLAMHRLPPLATLHTFSTVLAVLAISVSTRSPAVVLMCAAYVSGSEVLWRMSRAYTFHETAKYMVALLSLIGMIRLRRVRLPGWAVMYLALLLPSTVFTLYYFPLDVFRKATLYYLSGPIALTFCILFCSNLRLSISDLWRVAAAFVSPVIGVAAVTVSSSYLQQVNFTNESNFQTSGGFGPNQVASSLALGALLVALSILMARLTRNLRHALTVVAVLLAVQSAMTFSRGGILASAVSLACALPFVLAAHKNRTQVLAGLAGLFLLLLLLFPAVNAYTGGKLAERFHEKKMSGREQLAAIDWVLFEENPLFGVGVGISAFFHPRAAGAHTEFTRALAEHGLLGLGAYACLAWLLFRRVISIFGDRQNQSIRGFLIAMMAWGTIYMTVNATRTSAPAFALGLAFLTVLPVGATSGQTFRR